MTNVNTVREQLHQTALKAPSSSGVYLWRDSKETVIYVGKAKNLKRRLASYFAGNKDIKTRLLVSHAKTIEYITTANEYEAFLLENNLIKKYNPRYNINLKDGKSYPVLRITNEDYPRLFKTRSIVRDGSTYFGPYPDAGALDTFIDTLFQIYPIRHCKTLRKRDAPSLYYHIGQCSAPCCGKITKDQLEILRLLVKQQKKMAEQAIPTYNEFIFSDTEFHNIIVAATGNSLLRSLVDELRDKIKRTGINSLYSRINRVHEAAQEHETIVNALRLGDVEKAAAAMETHLNICYTSAYSYIVSGAADRAGSDPVL